MWSCIKIFLEAPTNVGVFLFASLAAALIAAWGVVTQRAIARRRATLDYIAKTESDAAIISARKKFIELAKDPGGLAPWAEAAKESTDEVQKIRTVLNDFELISIGIQRGIIDYELYRRWLRSGTLRYWNHAAPFVLHLRGRLEDEMIYHEFEELVRWLRENRKPRRGRWIGYWF